MIWTCRQHPQCSTPRCQELCWSVCDTKEMIHPALAQWTSVWTSRLDHTRCCQEPWMSRFVSDVVTKWQWNLLLESSQGWMIMTEWWDTTLVCCTPHDQCLWKYLTKCQKNFTCNNNWNKVTVNINMSCCTEYFMEDSRHTLLGLADTNTALLWLVS